MNERDKSEGKRHVPAQQAQQPQPSKALNDHIQPSHVDNVLEKAGKISELSRKDRLSDPGGGVGSEPENASAAGGAAVDGARFTAGVVKLYEALLKEPVPEEMLRLIDQIGQQERE